MSRTTDIVIIGAGIIGAAIAFELGKKGYNTVNIDKAYQVDSTVGDVIDRHLPACIGPCSGRIQ